MTCERGEIANAAGLSYRRRRNAPSRRGRSSAPDEADARCISGRPPSYAAPSEAISAKGAFITKTHMYPVTCANLQTNNKHAQPHNNGGERPSHTGRRSHSRRASLATTIPYARPKSTVRSGRKQRSALRARCVRARAPSRVAGADLLPRALATPAALKGQRILRQAQSTQQKSVVEKGLGLRDS